MGMEESTAMFLGGGLLIFYLAIIILYIVSNWKIYKKAGYEGWECIIPIYSYFVFLKIIGKPWYWFLFLFIPILNVVIYIWGVNLLSKRFGKDVGFTLGLLFLSIVFYPILAFSDAKYIPVGQEAPAEEPLTW